MGKRTPIVYLEWRSRDAERLKHFYKNAFRWKFDEGTPGYTLAHTGTEELGAGILQIEDGSSTSPGIVQFLDSSDLHAAEEAVRAAGGQVTSSANEVPGMGRFSLFTDPDGNKLGLWQSADAAKKADKHAKKEAKRAQEDQEDARAREEKKARKAGEKAAKKADDKANKKSSESADDVTAAVNPDAKKKKKKQ